MRKVPALYIALVACCAMLLAPAAGAEHGSMDPQVAARLAEVRDASVRGGYAPLRRLWQTWERADPRQVEAALATIAEDASVPAQLRVYAGVLEAYARRRRGDLEGAQRQLDHLGYVRDWFVIGPFENDNRTGLGTSHLIEKELDEPIVLDRSYQGKAGAVSWRRSPDVHRYGFVSLGGMFRPGKDMCAYATTYVRPEDAGAATLWVGVTGAVKLWHDTEQVLTDEGYRDLDADRRAVTVRLHEGHNRITAKVCGDETAPALALRVGGSEGAPLEGLETVATEAASTAAAAHEPAEAAPVRARVHGPLDSFARALEQSGDRVDPALYEAYAEYLYVTGGDADASHQARDLARKAAEAEPTVSRLLLAASLAENRNRMRRFLDEAEDLAETVDERVRWSVMKARWLRAGPNPRQAFPLYAEALQLDDRQVPAILGKVDLYVEAGLPRTALKTLQVASAEQPHAVALLRSLAARLRALGRDTEAAEVEARYAAYRFDDGGYLKDQLDLAVARRDRDGAERWAERLVESEPASTWAYGEVARARLRLGDRAGAIDAYERALEIAPRDVGTLRALADVYGTGGERDRQVALLRRILRVAPQAKSVRAYLEHIGPSRQRRDERYAWEPERFLEKRAVQDDRFPMRTLRKLNVTTVYENGLASHFHQVVFQPLTDEAAAQARQYAFVYHADRQVVTLRSAKVYRQDGRVDEAIESGEAPLNDPSIHMYTLQRTYYVQFPRLEPGDVVELQYRVEDVAARNEMSDYFGEIEYLQSTDPISDVEYVLIAPEDKQLQLSTGPGDPALANLTRERKEEGDRVIHRIHATDVPAIEAEQRMPKLGELMAHVHVSTFRDWEEVGTWYHGLARDKMDADESVRRLARELTADLETDREKVAAIYAYAAGETRYVALEFGIEGIRPRRAALTLARGWGDCKDKATLIVSMLREVGIEGEIVLVRSGLRGDFDPSTASLAPFDHAIAYVPSLDLYLDGTASHTGTGELPALVRGAMALRITSEGGKLVHLPHPPASASRDERRYSLELRPDGDLQFEATIENLGVDAPSWRRRYQDATTRRERVATDLATAFGGPVELRPGRAGLSIAGLGDVEEPVVIEAEGEVTADEEGAGYSVSMGPSFDLVSSHASRTSREHDLLVGPRKQRDEVRRLRVPAGMKVTSKPKAVKLDTPFGRYRLAVSEEDGTIEVRTHLSLDRARIHPDEYAAFRAFCQAVDAAGARVVLAPK